MTPSTRGALLWGVVSLGALALLFAPQEVASRSALYNTTSSRVAGKLNVHIISHTHNDPGWLSSYVQYHRALVLDNHVIGGVEAILHTVTSSLLDNPDRTFVYADLALFMKWWQELHEDSKGIVRSLVQQGQFEFTGGGVVQHDEANSHYSGMIDQMSLGMRFLQAEFGQTPRIAWQLDGFGHSRTEPLLKSQGGFDAIFFGRSDQADMEQRKHNHSLELLWRGSTAYGRETDMFVSQYPTGNYGPPSMTWFFERRNNYAKATADFIKDDPETGSFNVAQEVDMFVQKAKEWQGTVQGDDIFFFMGSDFTHSDAHMWFSNVDKLVHYVNKDGRVNAFYSTPSRYLAAKRSTPGMKLSLKTDDFFPYSANSAGSDYWTGYFTSRPTLKAQVRRGWALLRATHQLEVLAQLQPGSRKMATSKGLRYSKPQEASETVQLGYKLAPDHDAATLEFALATSLHHDGITGTQKQHVTRDYEQWIHVGMTKAAPKLLQGLQQLVFPARSAATSHNSNTSQSTTGTVFKRKLAQPTQSSHPAAPAAATVNGSTVSVATSTPSLSMCLNLNSSLCSSSITLSQGNGFMLVVYNPLSWAHRWGVRVPVAAGNYSVTTLEGKPVLSQLLPLSLGTNLIWSTSASAKEDQSRPGADLALLVSAPALRHTVYKVTRLPTGGSDQAAQARTAASEMITLAGDSKTLSLSSGKLQLDVKASGIAAVTVAAQRVNYSSSLIMYQGRFGGSGAYTFKAEGQPTLPASKVTVTKGPLVQEVRQQIDGLGVLTTRLWIGQQALEVEWVVKPPGPNTDWEAFVRYTSGVASDGVWFTDANGMEYQQRKRQYRPSFKLPGGSRVLAGNIYPITTGCYVQDAHCSMSVAVDRAQGVVSLADGQLDVNLHRTSAGDDGKGMNEPLLDQHVAAGTHIISFNMQESTSTGSEAAYNTRRHYEQVLNDPLVLAFSDLSHSKAAQRDLVSNAAAVSMPGNVHLLTVKWLSCDTVLMRLKHSFQAGEHPTLSDPTTVQLEAVAQLLRLQVTKVEEATLFGERPLAASDDNRPHYNYGDNITQWRPPLAAPAASFSFLSNRLVGSVPLNTRITINPMQIRTFFMTVQRSSSSSSCMDPPEPSRRVAAAHIVAQGGDGGGSASLKVFVQRASSTDASMTRVSSPGMLLALVLLPACVAAGILSRLIRRICCALCVAEGFNRDKWKAHVRKKAGML